MALVEAVAGKLEDLLPEAFSRSLGDSLVKASLDIEPLHLRHLVNLLLADGAPKNVRLSQRKPRDHLDDLHDLLLVEHDAIGLGKNWLDLGNVVLHLLNPRPAVQEVGDVVNGTGTVDRNQRNQVFKARGLPLAAKLLHPLGFQLEDGHGLALAKHLVGVLVVLGNLVGVDLLPGALLDEVERILDDGEGLQAQEVHLEQSQGFAGDCGELGDGLVSRAASNWRYIRHGHVPDDDARRVDGHVPVQSLQCLGVFPEFLAPWL